ncbi:MAG: CxxC-x17-CxxC domain-containing protein [Vampirovibrionales bacterium]|nr:CxxC-x17-CxxC domain-containing protein [Vampirovibrionales bacterium]
MAIQEITCTACSAVFEFTDEEQSFYEAKGFTPPRKCKPCRDAAKAERRGGGGYGGGGYGGGGYGGGRPPREMHDAVCAGCGVQTQVPFRPNGMKPVYCRNCFQPAARY